MSLDSFYTSMSRLLPEQLLPGRHQNEASPQNGRDVKWAKWLASCFCNQLACSNLLAKRDVERRLFSVIAMKFLSCKGKSQVRKPVREFSESRSVYLTVQQHLVHPQRESIKTACFAITVFVFRELDLLKSSVSVLRWKRLPKRKCPQGYSQ